MPESPAALVADLDDRDAVERAFAQIEAEHSSIDISVFAHIDPGLLVYRRVNDLSEEQWDTFAEAPVRSLLWWLQASFRRMRPGGRFLALCPTVAIEGAAGLAACAAAAEAQRAVMKSAARRWGERGMTCNVVAPPVWALAPDLNETDATRNVPVLPSADDPLAEVADAVVMLAGTYAGRLTGITLNADSGALMAP
jgi:NAD(P)-dependent dehydrogenase (short-subunit alcohol dehydrogenase family)